MSKLPSAASAATAVGIVGSSWIAGGIAGLSLFSMPGILSAAVPGPLLAQQWAFMFHLGKVTMPAIAVTSLAAYGYTAYGRSQRGLDWKRYATAGALTIAIVPFTVIFMLSTNQSLLQIAGGGAGAAVVNDDSVRALISKWAGLNLIRSLLPLGGAVLGAWTWAEAKFGSEGAATKPSGGKDVTKSHPASY